MKYTSEIAKLIEHGLSGNKDSVRAYAELLLMKMDQNNEDSLHIRIIKEKLGLIEAGERIMPL